MKSCSIGLVVFSFSTLSVYASATYSDLGTAEPFAILATSTITNTGPSVVNGDLGLYPDASMAGITGFPPGMVNGTVYDGNAVAEQAEVDATAAYNVAAGEACGSNLTGENLGGLTLTPGVYCFDSSAFLTTGTGILTLDAEGNPNAVFLFQIGSTLITASASSVDLINDAQGANVFWQVGSSATLGTSTTFEGNILADASITLTTGATIGCGSAFALNGAVTMDDNTVTSSDTMGCMASTGTPEPGTAPMLGLALFLSLAVYARQWAKQAA